MHVFAVHISDGVLQPAWLVGGFGFAAILVFVGSRRIRDEEIPTIAFMTSVFFVGSLIHMRIGISSVHLLLNSILGILLGMRACAAILVGLTLQSILLAHGGVTAIGINFCVMAVPALIVGFAFEFLRPRLRPSNSLRTVAFVFTASALFCACIVMGFANALASYSPTRGRLPDDLVWRMTASPAAMAILIVFSLVMSVVFCRLRFAPEFALGMLLGEFCVILTIGLNCLVLVMGGNENWVTLASVVFIANLPVAAVEAIVLGTMLAFLARVRPQLLTRERPTENIQCFADSRV